MLLGRKRHVIWGFIDMWSEEYCPVTMYDILTDYTGHDYFLALLWTTLNVSASSMKSAWLPNCSLLKGIIGVYQRYRHEESANARLNLFALYRNITLTVSNRYLETGCSPFGLQPWVWIIMLGFGPFIFASILTQFLYIGVSPLFAHFICNATLLFDDFCRLEFTSRI